MYSEGSSVPHTDVWHLHVFIHCESSNTRVARAVHVGEQCCGPK